MLTARKLRILLQIAVCLTLAISPLAAQDSISLVGSGSNVVNPLFSEWMSEFGKLHPILRVNYLSLGTSQSINEIRGGAGDFGAGEVPLSEAQKHGGKYALAQFPATLVAIVPIYKLPGEPQLKLSGDVLAEIFLGNIKNWKDPRIAKMNPTVTLPDLAITVVHFSGIKGSNYILSDFLSKTSPEWESKIGKSASPKWPVGLEIGRSEGMVDKVSATPGAIGYSELTYARRKNIEYASVQNAAGQFVKATTAGITAACTVNEKSMPEDFKISMTNAAGKESYPMVSFTWIYVPTSGLPQARSRALKDFWSWALSDGQEVAGRLGYAPLPPGIASKAQKTLNSIQ